MRRPAFCITIADSAEFIQCRSNDHQIMTGLLWGLVAAAMIGTSDCIARVTAQRIPTSVLTFIIMSLSLTCLSVWMAVSGDWPQWHTGAWFVSAVSGTLNVVVLYFLYKALTRGPVAVASPAASTFTVLLVGLKAVAGEPWSGLQLLAVAVVFLGIVMLARRSTSPGIDDNYTVEWLRITAMYGLFAAVAVSFRMFLAQEAGAQLGAMPALYLNRFFALIAVSLLLLYQVFRHIPRNWPTGKTLGLVSVQALLETLALGAFLTGSTGTGRVSAAIGFSAFATVTAVVAWVWLGERIGWQRGVWILVVASGVVLAMMGNPGN